MLNITTKSQSTLSMSSLPSLHEITQIDDMIELIANYLEYPQILRLYLGLHKNIPPSLITDKLLPFTEKMEKGYICEFCFKRRPVNNCDKCNINLCIQCSYLVHHGCVYSAINRDFPRWNLMKLSVNCSNHRDRCSFCARSPGSTSLIFSCGRIICNNNVCMYHEDGLKIKSVNRMGEKYCGYYHRETQMIFCSPQCKNKYKNGDDDSSGHSDDESFSHSDDESSSINSDEEMFGDQYVHPGRNRIPPNI